MSASVQGSIKITSQDLWEILLWVSRNMSHPNFSIIKLGVEWLDENGATVRQGSVGYSTKEVAEDDSYVRLCFNLSRPENAVDVRVRVILKLCVNFVNSYQNACREFVLGNDVTVKNVPETFGLCVTLHRETA